MKVIIDRFEEEYAVCEKEDRKIINIDKNKLPSTVKEGDVLIIDYPLPTVNPLNTIESSYMF